VDERLGYLQWNLNLLALMKGGLPPEIPGMDVNS